MNFLFSTLSLLLSFKKQRKLLLWKFSIKKFSQLEGFEFEKQMILSSSSFQNDSNEMRNRITIWMVLLANYFNSLFNGENWEWVEEILINFSGIFSFLKTKKLKSN